MLSLERYEKIIQSLACHFDSCSDVVNAEITRYDDYFTKTGRFDSRKKGFVINVVVSLYNLSGERSIKILADVFSRLEKWTKEWEKEIYFTETNIQPISGNNYRLEIEIYFDDLTESVKKLLLR